MDDINLCLWANRPVGVTARGEGANCSKQTKRRAGVTVEGYSANHPKRAKLVVSSKKFEHQEVVLCEVQKLHTKSEDFALLRDVFPKIKESDYVPYCDLNFELDGQLDMTVCTPQDDSDTETFRVKRRSRVEKRSPRDSISCCDAYQGFKRLKKRQSNGHLTSGVISKHSKESPSAPPREAKAKIEVCAYSSAADAEADEEDDDEDEKKKKEAKAIREVFGDSSDEDDAELNMHSEDKAKIEVCAYSSAEDGADFADAEADEEDNDEDEKMKKEAKAIREVFGDSSDEDDAELNMHSEDKDKIEVCAEDWADFAVSEASEAYDSEEEKVRYYDSEEEEMMKDEGFYDRILERMSSEGFCDYIWERTRNGKGYYHRFFLQTLGSPIHDDDDDDDDWA